MTNSGAIYYTNNYRREGGGMGAWKINKKISGEGKNEQTSKNSYKKTQTHHSKFLK